MNRFTVTYEVPSRLIVLQDFFWLLSWQLAKIPPVKVTKKLRTVQPRLYSAFTELCLAQICSIAEWNFVYSSLSYSVIGSLIIFIFPLFRLSIIRTIHFTLHKFWWSKVDCSHMYFWMYLCVGESWTWLLVHSAKSEVSTNYQDQDSSLKTNI